MIRYEGSMYEESSVSVCSTLTVHLGQDISDKCLMLFTLVIEADGYCWLGEKKEKKNIILIFQHLM